MPGKAVHRDAFEGFGVKDEAVSVIGYGPGSFVSPVHQVVLVHSPFAVFVSDASVFGEFHESFGSFPAESRTLLGAYVTVIGVLGVFVCGFKCSHAGLLSGSQACNLFTEVFTEVIVAFSMSKICPTDIQKARKHKLPGGLNCLSIFIYPRLPST